MRKGRRLASLALALWLLLLGLSTHALAGDAARKGDDALYEAMLSSAAYMAETVKHPQLGSVGGEWAVLGIARSGYEMPESYYQAYYAGVEDYVKACGGVLHKKKYTEYSRLTVVLTAIGKDPTNVGGYNLLTPLGDFDKTIWQGLNGPIWALIALDSGDYDMPVNPEAKTQATRQKYIDEILKNQLDDGGFSLTGQGKADPDMTGMALQALAKYQDQEKVKKVTDEALSCLSNLQNENGGYGSWGTVNSESVVQVIVALCELGIPLDDGRFVKNGHTLLENLLSFRRADGSFTHILDGSDGNNQMSSEQGLYALVAAYRAEQGLPSLYRMTDALSVGEGEHVQRGAGLPDKQTDVKAVPITAPGTTFDDAFSSEYVAAIEALAARGIINGVKDNTFAPENSMTRAQFATIVVRALGLTAGQGGAAGASFSDVAAGSWYHDYVLAAAGYGIVTGVGEGKFSPEGTITRQEAAVMVCRAAKLCGMETNLGTVETRDMLAQFGDYLKSADWARPSLAFCYREGILDDSVLDIQPKEAITRGEIAQMLFNLLTAANLL